MERLSMDALRQAANSQQSSANINGSQQSSGSQAANWVWVRMTEIYGEQWIRENGEVPSLMWKLSLSKIERSKVKRGIGEVVSKAITWPPNLPRFIELCEGVEDASESFHRLIAKQDPKDSAERITRGRIGFQCRTQLSECAARRLWASTLENVREGLSSGLIKDVDMSAKRIETPEKMKAALTPEQRNQQLDRQIDDLLEKGLKLYGPHKARFKERQNESDKANV